MVERRTRDRGEEQRDNFLLQGQFSVLTHLGIFFKRCFRCTETRDREPRTAISTFTQLHSSNSVVQVHCRFTSTQTVQTIRDGELTTATSTFTQLLSSVLLLKAQSDQ